MLFFSSYSRPSQAFTSRFYLEFNFEIFEQWIGLNFMLVDLPDYITNVIYITKHSIVAVLYNAYASHLIIIL